MRVQVTSWPNLQELLKDKADEEEITITVGELRALVKRVQHMADSLIKVEKELDRAIIRGGR